MEGPTPKPCNVCENCTAITKDMLFDVIEIDAASNRGIDDIRDLREKVRVPPIQARFKVYIIDEVHMLTREAFNALLKTLEEPPEHVIFLMATTEPHKLPSTILSRCQRFDFRRLTDGEIGKHITWIADQENFTIEEAALGTLVKTADGSLRDAISLLDQLVSFSEGHISTQDVNQVFGMPERQEIAKLMDAVFSGDLESSFDIFNEFFAAGKSFSLFVRFLMEYFRDLYFINQKIRPSHQLYDEAGLKPLVKQAKSVDRESLIRMLDEIARVEDRIRWETYPRIILEILLIKLVDTINGPGLTGSKTPRPESKSEAPPVKKEPIPETPAPAGPATRAHEEVAAKKQEKPLRAPLQWTPKSTGAEKTEKKAKAPAEDIIPDPEPPADLLPEKTFVDKESSKKSKRPAKPKSTKENVEPAALPETDDPDLKEVIDAWPNILSFIKNEDLPAYFLAADGVPTSRKGFILTVEFQNPHCYNIMSGNKYIMLLESALEKTLGSPLKAQTSLKGSKQVIELDPQPKKNKKNESEYFLKNESGAPKNMSLFDTLNEEMPGSKEIF